MTFGAWRRSQERSFHPLSQRWPTSRKDWLVLGATAPELVNMLAFHVWLSTLRSRAQSTLDLLQYKTLDSHGTATAE